MLSFFALTLAYLTFSYLKMANPISNIVINRIMTVDAGNSGVTGVAFVVRRWI